MLLNNAHIYSGCFPPGPGWGGLMRKTEKNFRGKNGGKGKKREEKRKKGKKRREKGIVVKEGKYPYFVLVL